MRKDITRLIKKTKNYLNEVDKIESNDNHYPEEKKELKQEKAENLRGTIEDRFNKMKKYNEEDKSVARSKLNNLYSGNDEKRQRLHNEVRQDLQGIEDADKVMEYYEEVKAKEPELKQVEARKVIKNKLWKNDNDIELNNFKEKVINDMPEEEKKYRQKIAKSEVKEKELNSLESNFKGFIVEEAINQGEIPEGMEKAMMIDWGNKEKIEKKAESKLIDTL